MKIGPYTIQKKHYIGDDETISIWKAYNENFVEVARNPDLRELCKEIDVDYDEVERFVR